MDSTFYFTHTPTTAHVQCSPSQQLRRLALVPFNRHVSAALDKEGWRRTLVQLLLREREAADPAALPLWVSWHGGWNAGLIPARVESCLWGMDSLPQCLLQNHLGVAKQGPCSTNRISVFIENIQFSDISRLIKFQSLQLPVCSSEGCASGTATLFSGISQAECVICWPGAVNPEHIISHKDENSLPLVGRLYCNIIEHIASVLTISISYLLWLFQKGLTVKDPWNLFLPYQIHSKSFAQPEGQAASSAMCMLNGWSLFLWTLKGLRALGNNDSIGFMFVIRLLASLHTKPHLRIS